MKKIFFLIFCFLFLSMIVLADVQEDKLLNKRGIRENIRTLRLLRMTRALDLTEEQAAKIFPAMNRIEKEKMKINLEIGQKIKELKFILDKEKPEEQEIEKAIEDLKRLKSLLKSKDEELESIIEVNLTLIQRAKYILFSVDFFRGLREKINRARLIREKLRKKDRR